MVFVHMVSFLFQKDGFGRTTRMKDADMEILFQMVMSFADIQNL